MVIPRDAPLTREQNQPPRFTVSSGEEDFTALPTVHTQCICLDGLATELLDEIVQHVPYSDKLSLCRVHNAEHSLLQAALWRSGMHVTDDHR